MKDASAERCLIAAIINCAIRDVVSGNRVEKQSAYKFLQEDSKLFEIYADLIDLDHVRLSRAIFKAMRTGRARELLKKNSVR